MLGLFQFNVSQNLDAKWKTAEVPVQFGSPPHRLSGISHLFEIHTLSLEVGEAGLDYGELIHCV